MFVLVNTTSSLDGNIFKYIKYANSKKVKNLLITNAMLLNNENKRKSIIESSPTVLKIFCTRLIKKFNWSRGTNLDVDDYFLRIYKLLSEIKGTPTTVHVDLACNFIIKRKKYLKNF